MTSPAVIPMCPMRRVVVVFPLVPVTDATGTLGLTTEGSAPFSAAVTAAIAALRAPSWTDSSGSMSALNAGPNDSPKARPRPRQRQGKATTTWSRDPPVRTRTPKRVVPDSLAMRRTTCPTSLMTARWRCSESGAPGRTPRSPSRVAIARMVLSSALR